MCGTSESFIKHKLNSETERRDGCGREHSCSEDISKPPWLGPGPRGERWYQYSNTLRRMRLSVAHRQHEAHSIYGLKVCAYSLFIVSLMQVISS